MFSSCPGLTGRLRILDLMCNASGELTQRGKLLRLHETILGGAQVLRRFRQRTVRPSLRGAPVLEKGPTPGSPAGSNGPTSFGSS